MVFWGPHKHVHNFSRSCEFRREYPKNDWSWEELSSRGKGNSLLVMFKLPKFFKHIGRFVAPHVLFLLPLETWMEWSNPNRLSIDCVETMGLVHTQSEGTPEWVGYFSSRVAKFSHKIFQILQHSLECFSFSIREDRIRVDVHTPTRLILLILCALCAAHST